MEHQHRWSVQSFNGKSNSKTAVHAHNLPLPRARTAAAALRSRFAAAVVAATATNPATQPATVAGARSREARGGEVHGLGQAAALALVRHRRGRGHGRHRRTALRGTIAAKTTAGLGGRRRCGAGSDVAAPPPRREDGQGGRGQVTVETPAPRVRGWPPGSLRCRPRAAAAATAAAAPGGVAPVSAASG